MPDIVIRKPNGRELHWITAQWMRDLLPSSARPGKEGGPSLPGIPAHAQYSGLRDGRTWVKGRGMWRSPDPMHLIHPRTYRMALALYVRDAIASIRLLVADHAAVPEEPIGWVAFETAEDLRVRSVDEPQGMVHYVRVLGPARRRGVGKALLQAAGCRVPSYLTPEGAALLLVAFDAGPSAPQPGVKHDRQTEDVAVVPG